MVEHPSGLENEGEIAYVSNEFWNLLNEKKAIQTRNAWAALLDFQQGWKACKDFYKINE